MPAQTQAGSGPGMQVRSLQRPKIILLAPGWGQGLPTGHRASNWAQSMGQECLKWPQELPA